ncbi:glutamate receptor ionotropic, delta-1-like [Palaemon carinicauda]|uniref:glutamate receptor ionotropic, delta-1-like n=1 Tax=Palaemon carinicauda TaxID=392227 RepID=UPI0035B5C350
MTEGTVSEIAYALSIASPEHVLYLLYDETFQVEDEATKYLQAILREGSQVIIIQMVVPGSLKLLSSIVDGNGNVGFRETTGNLDLSKGSIDVLGSEVFEDLEQSYSNFEGRQLSVAANDNNPFIVLKEGGQGELLLVAGFESAIVDSLSKALNFTYRMVTPEDGKWGGPLPNGSVVGMIGEVAYRRAHFAICEITITRAREEVIDFSYPHYIESLTLISRTPREKNRTFAAFSPFTPLVWFCIVATFLLMGPFLTFESWVIKKYQPNHQVLDSIEDFMLNLFGSLLKQENLINSQYWPHKLAFFFWYLFCLIISVLYSGMLTATLIIPSFEKPINSLTDLPMAIKDGFTIVVTDDTSDEYMFKNAKEGIYAETWKLFNHKDRAKSFVPHPSYAMDGIVNDQLVLINGILGARYLSMRRGIRRYHFARDSFASQYYGVACISGAPFMFSFNKILSYMIEGGLITKWVDYEFQKVAGNNIVIERSGPKAFTIKHLQAAFYILTIGYLASILFLGLEKLFARF